MSDKPELAEVPHKSLREAAYAAIREAIVSGVLRPGQRLVELDLAQRLGISRAPVREALRLLESEGLVVAEPHRGAHVAHFSRHDLWEIYTLRAAVEGLAVRLVAASPTLEVIDRLESLVHQMRETAACGERERLTDLDLEFHRTICQAANHRRLLEAWEGMSAQVRMFVAITSQHRLPPEQLVRYHEVVLEAIRHRDPDRAEATLKSHILEYGERIAGNFETLGSADPSSPQEHGRDTSSFSPT